MEGDRVPNTTPLRGDTRRELLTLDSPVRLVGDPDRLGHVHLIDRAAQRASVRWTNGLISGVALADIEPVSGPGGRGQAAPVAAPDVVPAVFHPAEQPA